MIQTIHNDVKRIREVSESILIQNFLNTHCFLNQKYMGSKRITHFHRSVYSQNGEDGILAEIFSRIKTTNKVFVEFGAHGVKNNSTYLLIKNWSGFWIGGGKKAKAAVSKNFDDVLQKQQLVFKETWIDAENIEDIFDAMHVPTAFDFLSIDIDGNDYWVWKAIKKFSPRVVAIEYNATIPPSDVWIMNYNPHHVWNHTSYYGTSLKALEMLGKEKGYSLVGCDFSGCNAFFVRNDQNLSDFQEPFTAEFHYEPARYFLRLPHGHLQGFGPFITSV